MRASRSDTATQTLLALSGEVGGSDVDRLRHLLVDALDDGERDLLVDAHAVTAFDDAALAALVSGRSRAKARRHRMVVLDGFDGALARSLSRTGLNNRMPVYADASAAERGLSADRAAVALRSGAFGGPREGGPALAPPDTRGSGSGS